MGKTVLIVEDEQAIVEILKYNLQKEGYETLEALDGETGLQLAREQDPDLMLLDLGLPDRDGQELLSEIRAWSSVPVVVVSARGQETDKVRALDSGADDYVAKPFGMMELLSRIRALLRRTERTGGPLRLGCLEVDPDRHTVHVEGREVALTQKEFEVLCLLLRSRGRVLSREILIQQVWGYAFTGESRTVDVHMRTLRQKLGPAGAYIETVRGYGYKISEA